MDLEPLERDVLQAVERRMPAIVSFLQSLVRVPSIVGQEAAAQQVIAARLRDLGFRLDVWEPDLAELRTHPEFQPIPDDYRNRPVVVGTWSGAGGGRSLILNGHIDVVSAEAEADWPHGGPWSGTVVDGRLYGRGSTDMKGGLVAFIEAVATLAEMGIRLRGDVIVQSVVDEERGGNGTLAAMLRGYRADGAVIGEPTNMTLVTKNAGALWVRINVPGKAAHGAYKDFGINAIDKAILVYRALLDLEAERLGRFSDPLFAHYQHPFPFSFGVFRAGDWPSVIPDCVVMEGRVGFSPDEDHRDFRRELEARVAEVAASDPWLCEHPPVVEWFGLFMDSAGIAVDHPLVQTARAAMERVLGRAVELKGKAGGTDMRLLVNAGVPTLQIGPGLSAEAHTLGESVPVRNVIDVTKTVALMLVRWCGVA